MTAATVRHKGDLGGITCEADLDRIIKLIGRCDLEIERFDQELDLAVKKVQAEALAKRGPIAAERSGLLAMVETYLRANRAALLNGKKSRKLNFGEIGFRKAAAVIELPAKGSAEMGSLAGFIEIFAEQKPEIYGGVTVHIDRYVLKTDLRDLPLEALDELKIEHKPGEDRPFVKPNREKCLEVSEAA
jgi:phage host-nuclease inhibitor protein Gam